jgi:hypothetical protein
MASHLLWIRKQEIEVVLELMGKAISSLVVRRSYPDNQHCIDETTLGEPLN